MELKQLKDLPSSTNASQMIAVDMSTGGIKERLVYCLENDCFYVYTNGYWKSLFITELLSLVDINYPGVNKFGVVAKKQVADQLKIQVHKKLELFNTFDLLNFPSGMFDAKGNNMIAHDYKMLSTIRLPYNYDMLAECPLWLNTLDGIFEGNRDKIDVLQEFFGYCLTRDVTREKALLLLGESRSGKSTILDTINHVIGEDNVSSVALEYLANPQYTPMLINKMVNIDWDVASGAEKFEANFKIITSGEPVGVNQKFIRAFTFRPYCKLIMAANKFPRITDHSSAFYKRLILLPCDRIFEPHEQDIRLKIKLLEERSGIFNWAVEGLHRLEERGGFEISKEFMVDALNDLREESNPIEGFFAECIVADNDGVDIKIEKGELYHGYCKWCKINGNSALSAVKFSQMVYQKYSKFTPKKSQCYTSGKRIWRNLVYTPTSAMLKVKDGELVTNW